MRSKLAYIRMQRGCSRILSGQDCLAHNLKRMNLIDSDICVFNNENSIVNHLFQCISLNRETQQAKDMPLLGSQRENGVKSKILVIRNNNNCYSYINLHCSFVSYMDKSLRIQIYIENCSK